MEEISPNITEEVVEIQSVQIQPKNNSTQIAGAIIIAGLLIAGAILLKGSGFGGGPNLVNEATLQPINIAPVGASDRALGVPDAKVTLVMYEDFQCPFCGRFHSDSEKLIRDTYVKDGKIQLVYRDFAFLGPESQQAAEAARCAEDQGKFWEYHDYLFEHQNGENKGGFADPILKSFAKTLGLDAVSFNTCLDQGKYTKAVIDSKTEGGTAGVIGTPKGFLITKKDISTKMQNAIMTSLAASSNSADAVTFFQNKKIVSLNGALPYSMVKPILDILLK